MEHQQRVYLVSCVSVAENYKRSMFSCFKSVLRAFSEKKRIKYRYSSNESLRKLLNIKKNTRFDDGNPCSDMGMAQQFDGYQTGQWNPKLPTLIIGSPTTTQIYTCHFY